jgi:hypothetical protein
MRTLFSFLLASFFVSGCINCSPPTSTPDAGPMVESDGGEPDTGPMVEPDAGPLPVELLVEPTYVGDGTASLGQQDVLAMAEIRLTALVSELIWNGGLSIKIEAQGSSRCVVRGTVSSPGESGTEYFDDIRVVNLDTGETLFGPVTMPSVPNGSPSTGFFWIGASSIAMIPSMPIRVGVTMDISETEFLPREVSGCTYRVYYGITDLDAVAVPSSFHYPEDEHHWLRPEQVGGDNAPFYTSFTVDAVP